MLILLESATCFMHPFLMGLNHHKCVSRFQRIPYQYHLSKYLSREHVEKEMQRTDMSTDSILECTFICKYT